MSYLQLIHSKKTISIKHYLQFLSFKKHLVLIRKKKSFRQTKIIQIKNISFQLKQFSLIIKRRNYFQGQLHSY